MYWSNFFRGTSSRRRKADLEKSTYPEEITSAAVAHDGGNQSWEVLGTELEKLCEAMNIVQAKCNLIEIWVHLSDPQRNLSKNSVKSECTSVKTVCTSV